MRQLILDLAWDPLPPFAGFLPGDNAAVVAQLREQGWPGAPLYLWGPAGCGKTQLLRELQARAVEAGLVAQWFDASTTTPWELADDAALVLLDGVDQWSDAQQHAAFTLFVEAASRVGGAGAASSDAPAAGARLGVQFASAGRLPPVDLQVREDLRTRLGWVRCTRCSRSPRPTRATRCARRPRAAASCWATTSSTTSSSASRATSRA